MKHAAQLAGLSQQQLDDIFWNNAKQVFGLKAA
jgi:predicted TIM-barrel fold metal-dependent hydrolase